jgi:6-phosphogluconolactonase
VLRVFASPAELCDAAREEFVARARAAIAERGRFMVALSGGSTPRALYQSLAQVELEWERVHFFFGDERAVAPNHADSNYRMAHEALFARAPIPTRNLHRIRTEHAATSAGANLAALEYENALRQAFTDDREEFPRFDLVLLGLGDDGHTASLFPGTLALGERERWVVATWVEKLASFRVTLTVPVINDARCVLFLVAGAGKAQVLHDVLEGPQRPDELPAQAIAPAYGELVWFADRAAAGALRS